MTATKPHLPDLPKSPQKSAPSPHLFIRRIRLTLFSMLGIFLATGLGVGLWFIREDRVTAIFKQVELLFANPPLWLAVPVAAGNYLAVPSVLLLVAVLIVMQVSSSPRPWSRLIVGTSLLLLIVQYVVWRLFWTLNLSDTFNSIFSIGLLTLEIITIVTNVIQLILVSRSTNRLGEADINEMAVLDGDYLPTVDVMIPTYDEPSFILKRTIIGCQAMDYPRKTVYLLDDTRRPEIKALATELGCEYIIRPDNLHAKAGNLNHALNFTSGELLTVFDADFVPTKNFLRRTVGFFQNDSIALLQTHQSFFNPDPVARNIGLENILPQEVEIFSRYYQPLRDGVETALCYGSSFVARRSALAEAGGFATGTLSEDYFTGVRLSAKGKRVIFLGESLSAGLSAENMSAHITQRLRWARGTLQAFFIEANPLRIRGLKLIQRLAHLDGLLQWFTSVSRVGFLLMPLAYAFFGVIPWRATTQEMLYFFMPYYLVQLFTFSWLNQRSRSALISDIYAVSQCFPVALTVLQTLFNPFSKGFKVTPKGVSSDRYTFNWKLASPLVVLFIFTAVSLWRNLGMCMVKGAWSTTVEPEVALQIKGIELGWLWSSYNLIVLGVALLILLDAPKPDLYEWFDLRRTVRLTLGNLKLWGITTMISEGGAEIALTQAGLPRHYFGESVQVEIQEENLCLQAVITQIQQREDDYPIVQLKFAEVTTPQYRRLVEMLFCRPGQWKSPQAPGELQSLYLLVKSFFTPRILFDRQRKINPVEVAKT